MTVAICIKCGSSKFGAFCTCERCSAYPETEEDLALSMMLTDHCHSREELERYGQTIADGKALHVDPATREKLISFLRIRDASVTLKRMSARSAVVG